MLGRCRQETFFVARVDQERPRVGGVVGEGEIDRAGGGVKKKKKSAVGDAGTFPVVEIEHCAVEENTEGFDKGGAPFIIIHLFTERIEPHDVFDVCTAMLAALEEFGASEDGVGVTEVGEASREAS